MAAFRFSRRAEADLLGIGAHTLRTWGEDQTIRYLDDPEACRQMPADYPGTWEEIEPPINANELR